MQSELYDVQVSYIKLSHGEGQLGRLGTPVIEVTANQLPTKQRPRVAKARPRGGSLRLGFTDSESESLADHCKPAAQLPGPFKFKFNQVAAATAETVTVAGPGTSFRGNESSALCGRLGFTTASMTRNLILFWFRT